MFKDTLKFFAQLKYGLMHLISTFTQSRKGNKEKVTSIIEDNKHKISHKSAIKENKVLSNISEQRTLLQKQNNHYALSAADEESEYINAKHRGVKDISTLQALIDSLNEGDTIYLSSDLKFNCDKSLKINVSDIKIIGTALFVLNNSRDYCMDVRANNICIEGIRFSNPSQEKMINGIRSGAIYINGDNTVVTNCKIDGMLCGILVSSGTSKREYTGTRIINNQITNCLGAGREDVGDGVCIFGSKAIVIGNTITCQIGEDARIGINIEALKKRDTSEVDGKCIVMGNIITGSFRRGIHVEADNTIIVGNTISGNTWWGIMCYGDGNIISSNIVYAPRFKIPPVGNSWNPTTSGIQIYKGEGNIVINNWLSGGSANGVRLHSQVSNNIIANNILQKDKETNNKFDIGIYSNEASDVLISNNILKAESSAIRGIYLWKPEGFSLQGNYISACGRFGIKVDGAKEIVSNLTVSNNTVKNNTEKGMEFINVDSLKITENIIVDNQSVRTQNHGIYMYNCHNFEIVNNTLTGNNLPLSLNFSGKGVIENNLGFKTKNGALASFSASGVDKIFIIPHELDMVPTKVSVTPASIDAISFDYFINYDTKNIAINFLAPPKKGVDNIKLTWIAEA
ncbi:right-handed parallel beta-helix repeat-containing protein [Priestia sp. FSL R5-0680]|uniref:right-handed parallel beta-helix repeat-containing protein n=1 Tax=Priestia sp. FSL R5-0680 TaxID=2921582 RepID=UPI0030F54467